MTTLIGKPVSEVKRKTRTKNAIALVEIERDVVGLIKNYIELPMPDNVKTMNRAGILAAVKEAAETGDTTYDGKEITVISYQPSVTVITKQVRKVNIQ